MKNILSPKKPKVYSTIEDNSITNDKSNIPKIIPLDYNKQKKIIKNTDKKEIVTKESNSTEKKKDKPQNPSTMNETKEEKKRKKKRKLKQKKKRKKEK